MKTLILPSLALVAILLSACSNQANDTPAVSAPVDTTAEVVSSAAANDGDCVAQLPFARGKTFCSLDEYLAHLEALSAVDLPWWREISPGVYEHVKRMPGAEREIATRQELMERFGFER